MAATNMGNITTAQGPGSSVNPGIGGQTPMAPAKPLPFPGANLAAGQPGSVTQPLTPKAPPGQPGALPTSSGLPTPFAGGAPPAVGTAGSTQPGLGFGPMSAPGAPPPAPLGAPAAAGALGSASAPRIPPPGAQPQAPAPPPAPLGSGAPSPGAPPNPNVAPVTTPALSPYGPGHDLQGSQINLAPNAATGQTNSQIANLAGNLSDPNNYQKAAQGSFNTFAQQSDPAYQASIRAATQAAAANGGIGSGNLSTTYGNLANQRNLQLEGMQQTSQQNALREQQGYQLSQLGALQGVAGQQFGQQEAGVNQLNQQQRYQTGMNQQAIQNAAQQMAMQSQLQNQAFNQNLNLLGAGQYGNPSGAYNQAAAQQGMVAQAAFGESSQLAQQNALQQAFQQAQAAGYGGQVGNALGGAAGNLGATISGLGLQVPQQTNTTDPTFGGQYPTLYGGGSPGVLDPSGVYQTPPIPQGGF